LRDYRERTAREISRSFSELSARDFEYRDIRDTSDAQIFRAISPRDFTVCRGLSAYQVRSESCRTLSSRYSPFILHRFYRYRVQKLVDRKFQVNESEQQRYWFRRFAKRDLQVRFIALRTNESSSSDYQVEFHNERYLCRSPRRLFGVSESHRSCERSHVKYLAKDSPEAVKTRKVQTGRYRGRERRRGRYTRYASNVHHHKKERRRRSTESDPSASSFHQ